MYYCDRCRLYFDEEALGCPLCKKMLINIEQQKKPVFNSGNNGNLPRAEEQESFWVENKKLDTNVVKRRIISLILLLAVLSVVIMVGVNFTGFLTTGSFALTTYPGIVSVMYSAFILWVLIQIKSIPFGILLIALSTSIFLILLNLWQLPLSWSFFIGIPIVWAVVLPWFLLTLTWKKVRIKGLNIVAYFSLGLSLSALLIDFTLSFTTYYIFSTWSIITALVFLATAILLFYLHYVLKLHINFEQLVKIKRTNTERDIL
jgi:hypothetical protein